MVSSFQQRPKFWSGLGLWQYDFRWHVGDRTTILSTADVDFFTGGQQLYTVGALLNRSARGVFTWVTNHLVDQLTQTFLLVRIPIE